MATEEDSSYDGSKSAMMMTFKQSGKLGFFGGKLKKGESHEDCLDRHLRLNFNLTYSHLMPFEKIVSYRLTTEALSTHFYVKKISMSHFLEIGSSQTFKQPTPFGKENLGFIRIPICTEKKSTTKKMISRKKPTESFLTEVLKNNLHVTCMEQTIYLVTKLQLLPRDEIDRCVERVWSAIGPNIQLSDIVQDHRILDSKYTYSINNNNNNNGGNTKSNMLANSAPNLIATTGADSASHGIGAPTGGPMLASIQSLPAKMLSRSLNTLSTTTTTTKEAPPPPGGGIDIPPSEDQNRHRDRSNILLPPAFLPAPSSLSLPQPSSPQLHTSFVVSPVSSPRASDVASCWIYSPERELEGDASS